VTGTQVGKIHGQARYLTSKWYNEESFMTSIKKQS